MTDYWETNKVLKEIYEKIFQMWFQINPRLMNDEILEEIT